LAAISKAQSVRFNTMTNWPLHIPLVGKDGKVDMTSPWLSVLSRGVSQETVKQIVETHVTKTIQGLSAGSIGGIPVAANSIVSSHIQENSVLGVNIAPVTISERHIVNGSLTGLSMALQTILVSGDTWTDNSPSAGYTAWSAFTIAYNGARTVIDADSTNLMYIYWDGASPTLTSSNTNPILGDGSFMIATNVNGVHSIAYNKIALQQVGAAWIQSASITDAQIASLNANKITAGSIRSINVQASTFMTRGTFLTQAANDGDAVVTVDNTVDFPASGTAQIIDTVNDRNTFTYTGTTANTLTGCTGVLAHASGATVVVMGIKAFVIDSNVNEMRFFNDVGGGLFEEIADIGSTDITGAVGSFGTLDSLNIGVQGKSSTQPGVRGASVSSYGGAFSGQAGALQLGTVSSLPASPQMGDIAVDTNGNIYIGRQGISQTVLISAATSQVSPDNGLTWLPGTLTSRAWSKPVWNGTVYCVVANGTNISATSADGGFTWTEHAGVLPSTAAWGALVWNGAVFFCLELGGTSTKGASSPDGVVWTARTLPSAVWSAATTNGTILAIVGPNKSATSTNNGSSWSAAAPAIIFFAVSCIGARYIGISLSRLYSSTDGLAWTSRYVINNTLDFQFMGINTFNNIAVATIYSGTFTKVLILRSVDGLAWAITATITPVTPMSHLDKNGQQFILTLNAGSTAYGSTDGIAWPPITLPASSTWIGLTGFYTSGGWTQLGWSTAVVSGSNATTTGQSLVDVTMDRPIPLLANATYEFKALLNCHSTGTNGVKFGVGFSGAAPVSIEARSRGALFSNTGTGRDRITDFHTATVVFFSAAEDGEVTLEGIIVTGANPGNLTIQHLKVTSGTSTVYVNSFLKARLISG
jgi:hypothetical protein